MYCSTSRSRAICGRRKSKSSPRTTSPAGGICRASAGAVRPPSKSSVALPSRSPDMKFDIKEILVSGDRVIVRGEVTGTPAGDLFGVPHTGKSFRIMAIDIQTIRDGKIARTYHLENWLSALGQLRAK